MLRRYFVSGLIWFAAVAMAPQEPVATSPLPRVILETTLGPIVVEIETQKAPITAANFLRYVDEGRMDGTSFYRAMNAAPGYGIVQGGTNYDPVRTLPPIAHEPTSLTGLSHRSGVLSMARHEPGSATGDFFIMVGDLVSYDAGRPNSVDPDGYAAFGRVVEGVDIVHHILAAPTSPTEGEGFMRGQFLEPEITILSASRAAAETATP